MDLDPPLVLPLLELVGEYEVSEQPSQAPCPAMAWEQAGSSKTGTDCHQSPAFLASLAQPCGWGLAHPLLPHHSSWILRIQASSVRTPSLAWYTAMSCPWTPPSWTCWWLWLRATNGARSATRSWWTWSVPWCVGSRGGPQAWSGTAFWAELGGQAAYWVGLTDLGSVEQGFKLLAATQPIRAGFHRNSTVAHSEPSSLQISSKRSSSFKRAIANGQRALPRDGLLDEPGLGVYKRFVRYVAYEILPCEVDRRWYFYRHRSCPPPVFMASVTLAQVGLPTCCPGAS